MSVGARLPARIEWLFHSFFVVLTPVSGGRRQLRPTPHHSCSARPRAVRALILWWATWSGQISLPIMCGRVLLGVEGRSLGAAFGALAPNLVPRDASRAIALRSTAWQTERSSDRGGRILYESHASL